MEQIRSYFRFILSSEDDFEMAGEAASGKEAVAKAAQLKPDIILMDIAMETKTAGIQAAGKIKESLAGCKVIMLTIHKDEELMFSAYMNGAMDYIVKTAPVTETIHSIRNVCKNNLNLRPEIAKRIMSELTRMKENQSSMVHTLNMVSKLTNAEFEILRSFCLGKSHRQIAQERFVEEVTIRVQVSKILKKFNVHKISQLISLIKDLKIFDIYK